MSGSAPGGQGPHASTPQTKVPSSEKPTENVVPLNTGPTSLNGKDDAASTSDGLRSNEAEAIVKLSQRDGGI